MRLGPILLLSFLALSVQSCANSSPERFMGLDWNSNRAEVMDSVDRWRFKYNEAKARWKSDVIRGIAFDKLKLGFDSTNHLNFIEAHHQKLDPARSEEIKSFWLERTSRIHGKPASFAQTGDDKQRLSRWLW